MLIYFVISFLFVEFGLCKNVPAKSEKLQFNSVVDAKQDFVAYFDSLMNSSGITMEYNRLNDNIYPLSYNISLSTDFNLIKSKKHNVFYGYVSILIKIKNPTDRIVLNCGINIVFDKVTLQPLDGDSKRKSTLKLVRINSEVIVLKTQDVLQRNARYIIHFQNMTSGYILLARSGWLVRFFENSDNPKNNVMLSTQMQPESARRVFPCFDEPQFKSNFQLKLTTNAEYNLLFNMPEIYCKINTDNKNRSWKTCLFEKSLKMTTYNVAIAIVPFKYIQKIDNKGRIFRIWARNSQIKRANFALETTVKIFQLYENEFDIEFPLKKIDSLAIPNLNGFLGMEHYGLITYDEPIMIYANDLPFSYSKELTILIIAHEVGHQWFGNLVTNNWWQDLWLNEGFTTFYSYKIAGKFLGNVDYFDYEKVKLMNYVRQRDDDFFFDRLSVRSPVTRNTETKFNYLSYKKGSLICDMLENIMGQSLFRKSMIDYLMSNGYTSVNTSRLWQSVNKHFNHFKIDSILNNWLNKYGYPVLSIYQSNGTLTINQNTSDVFGKHYKFSNYDPWNISVNYQINSNKPELILINSESKDITLPNQTFENKNWWLLINVNISSFLIVDYSNELFDRIINQFLTNHNLIPKLNRAQILQDFYYLSNQFKNRNLVKLLEILTYLRKENDFLVISSGITLLDKLHAYFHHHYFYIDWINYVEYILKSSFQRLLNDFRSKNPSQESTLVSWRRNVLYIACKIEHEICDEISGKIMVRWKSQSLLNTDFDLIHLALCREIQLDRTGRIWMEIFNNTKIFNSWEYNAVKYYVIGCSKVSWVQDKIYASILYGKSPEVYPHLGNQSQIFTPDFLEGITPVNRLTLLSIIINNPDILALSIRFKEYSPSFLQSIFDHTPYFPLSHAFLEYLYPTRSHIDFGTKYATYSMDIAKAMNNIEWIETNLDDIESYLKQFS